MTTFTCSTIIERAGKLTSFLPSYGFSSAKLLLAWLSRTWWSLKEGLGLKIYVNFDKFFIFIFIYFLWSFLCIIYTAVAVYTYIDSYYSFRVTRLTTTSVLTVRNIHVLLAVFYEKKKDTKTRGSFHRRRKDCHVWDFRTSVEEVNGSDGTYDEAAKATNRGQLFFHQDKKITRLYQNWWFWYLIFI